MRTRGSNWNLKKANTPSCRGIQSSDSANRNLKSQYPSCRGIQSSDSTSSRTRKLTTKGANGARTSVKLLPGRQRCRFACLQRQKIHAPVQPTVHKDWRIKDRGSLTRKGCLDGAAANYCSFSVEPAAERLAPSFWQSIAARDFPSRRWIYVKKIADLEATFHMDFWRRQQLKVRSDSEDPSKRSDSFW